MNSVNKFGESSTKLNNSRSRICEYNFKINRLDKDIKKIYSTYDSELKTIKSEINTLRETVTKDIDKDIDVIQKTIENLVNVANKKFISNIESRFSHIEDFIFKNLLQPNAPADVKKKKIEFPKIKVAK